MHAFFPNILSPKITKLIRSVLRLFGKRILAKNVDEIDGRGQFHQILYAAFKIPKVQKDSQVISVYLHF
jgi:hypothetical protein